MTYGLAWYGLAVALWLAAGLVGAAIERWRDAR